MKRFLIVLAVLGSMAGPGFASSFLGTWQTPLDAKQTTGYVQIVPCGASLCGTVISAFDKAGKPIVTPSVGKRVLWDVMDDGTSGNGRVYVPTLRAEFPVVLTAHGNTLILKACSGLGVCKTQVWNRVR